jgi:hypothetical protein
MLLTCVDVTCVDVTCVDVTCVDVTCVDVTCVDVTCVDVTCVDVTCVDVTSSFPTQILFCRVPPDDGNLRHVTRCTGAVWHMSRMHTMETYIISHVCTYGTCANTVPGANMMYAQMFFFRYVA